GAASHREPLGSSHPCFTGARSRASRRGLRRDLLATTLSPNVTCTDLPRGERRPTHSWPRGSVPLLAQTLWATESIGSALLGLVDEAGDAAVGDDPYDGHGDIAGQGYHHAGAAQCQCGDDADQVQEGRGLALDVGAQYARLDEDHATVVVDRTSSWPARSGTRASG